MLNLVCFGLRSELLCFYFALLVTEDCLGRSDGCDLRLLFGVDVLNG